MKVTNSIALIALNRCLANLRYAADVDQEYDRFCTRVYELVGADVLSEDDAAAYIDAAYEEKERTSYFRSHRSEFGGVL